LIALVCATVVLCMLLLCACTGEKASENGEQTDTKTGDTTAVATTTTATEPTTTPTTQKGYADGGVSVRDEPGLGGENIDTLYEQEITIVDKEGDWYEIEYTNPYGDHKTGYVSGDVIEIEGNPNKSEMNESKPTTTTIATTTVSTTGTGTGTTATGTNGETSPTNTDTGSDSIPETVIVDDPNW